MTQSATVRFNDYRIVKLMNGRIFQLQCLGFRDGE